MLRSILLISACAISTSVFAQAVEPAKAFGAREAVQQISLSPDGTKLGYIAPTKGQGNALFTVDISAGGQPRRVVVASGDPERLNRCNWVSNARLVCTIYAVRRDGKTVYALTRLIAVNADATDLKLVSTRQSDDAVGFAFSGGQVVDWLPSEDGAVLMARNYIPEARVGSLIEKKENGLGVDRIDTSSLAAKRVVKPIGDANQFITDGLGNVRIMGRTEVLSSGYNSTTQKYYYRPVGRDNWELLSNVDLVSGQGFDPYAVDPVENVAFGFQSKDGRQALYKRSLDAAQTDTLVFARPDVDVDGLLRLGRKQRIVGVTFATDRRQAEYFDPALSKLRTALGKALPDAPLINFQGASADETKLLIWAGGDVNPGQYYLFDRTSKKLSPLLPKRPELSDYKLAAVKSISVRASDGTMVPSYLTLPPGSTGKNLPTIVMPHGGPGSRDEWGFDWLAQFYANRGYAVLQPNFRGSTGYGDKWFQNNGFQSWKIAIGDVTDAGRWLVAQGIADPAKLAIVGWSYGGYAALQSGVMAPDLFKAIVAIAPVTDFGALKDESARFVNARTVKAYVGSGPHIIEGSPAQNASRIKAPVLMFHGDFDRNVNVDHSKMMAGKLKSAGKANELVIFPGLDHYLEDSTARTEMLSKSDAFLRKAMGM